MPHLEFARKYFGRLALPLASFWYAIAPLPAAAADPSPAPAAAEASPVPSAPTSASPNPTLAPAGGSSPNPLPSPNPNESPVSSASPNASAIPGAPSPGSIPPSENVTINLIRRLVQRHVLSQADADDLFKMAEADAAKAKAEAAAQQAAAQAVPPGNQPSSLLPSPASVAPPPLTQQGPPPEPSAPPESADSVHVTYIPEIVKKQLRQEIKQEVLAEVGDGKYIPSPSVFPEWVSRIRIFGDLRVRYEGDYYPTGNDNTGGFPNFNAINTGPALDVSVNPANTSQPPEYDVDKDRNRFRIRGRVGLIADLGEGFSLGVRGATGENDSPVTENQTLGVANNGQGGNFSKYAVWLDRAFIKYDLWGRPEKDLSITVGRFDNPFFATTIPWASDLGFDGVVIQGKYQVAKGVTPFLTVGAFPVFNTDLNFGSTNPAKFSSEDKYLYAIQGGTDWRINRDFNLKLGAAYYYFDNIQGRLSSPFTPINQSDSGDTDDSRPAFAQNGNTYMALRNIVIVQGVNQIGNAAPIDQWQYFGLATPFHELAIDGQLDYNHFEPFQISLYGEFIENLAFDRSAIDAVAVNNRGANTSSPTYTTTSFSGGDTAWILGVRVGSATMQKRWDWNLDFNYRYVESDSVVDGFTDSDFGGPTAGTNLKGFTIGANLALSSNVWVGIRWMSSNSIAGPPLKDDVLQVDLNGKF